VRGRRERFKRAVAVVGMLALAALFFGLGQWQYGRAADSRALAARFAAGESAAVSATAPRADERYARFRLTGRYLPEQQFLLDNVVEAGRVGYYVLTPFAVDADRALVLVNRGFVAAAPDRGVLPDVAVGGGVRTITGHVDVLPRPGLRLAEPAAPRAAAPVTVLNFPTAAELAARLGRPVHNYQLRLGAAEPDGDARDWRSAGVPPERHLAYAGQGWALAAAAAGTGVVLAVRARGQRHAR
jgi:surfeit locus 1 family protein